MTKPDVQTAKSAAVIVAARKVRDLWANGEQLDSAMTELQRALSEWEQGYLTWFMENK